MKGGRVGGGSAKGAAVSEGVVGAGGVGRKENGGGEGGGGQISGWEDAQHDVKGGKGDEGKGVERDGKGGQEDEHLRLVPPEDGWVEVERGEGSGECFGRGCGGGQVTEERGDERGPGAGLVEMTQIDKEREQLLAGGYVPER